MNTCINCKKDLEQASCECPCCGWRAKEHLGYLTFAPELAFVNDGFNVADFAVLNDLEGKHFWFNNRNDLILWAIKKYFNGNEIKNLLEIGCGTGFVLSFLQRNMRDTNFFGSDIYIEFLNFAGARCYPETQFFQMDASNIPFRNKFNIIGAFDVLEHIKEDDQVLSETHKALVSKGGLILTVPQHQWCWSMNDEYAHHVRRYDRKELQRQLERCGFKILLNISFVSFLLPIVIISRIFSNKNNYVPTKELKLPKIINFLFDLSMKLEIGLIKCGFKFPFGSSCLIVAKKTD